MSKRAVVSKLGLASAGSQVMAADHAQFPLLLTVPAAARLLGVGRSTAYELIAAGELEVVHIGRSARVPVAAIDAYIDRLRARAGVTAAP